VQVSDLPALNATLNATSAAFLLAGYVLIRRGRWQLHRRCMLGALTTSTLFLISYVVYHANAGSGQVPGGSRVGGV
jgi:putative membrane protein